MPSFGKIVGAVSENEPEHMNAQTNGGDSIGPFGFQPGTNNWVRQLRYDSSIFGSNKNPSSWCCRDK